MPVLLSLDILSSSIPYTWDLDYFSVYAYDEDVSPVSPFYIDHKNALKLFQTIV